MHLAFVCNVLGQESDTVILQEIEIKSSRISINQSQNLRSVQILDADIVKYSSCTDVASILKENTLVDIRQRSFAGVQSDLSIRGGSFDQNLVLLNGINLSDPQTGHHSLNVPVTGKAIHGIELVYGPASGIFGPNALTGAVNIISHIPEYNSLNFELKYGSFNSINSSVGVHIISRKVKHSVYYDFASSDGFTYNTDYTKSNVYYETNTDLSKLKLKTMIGFLNKNFGSNSFYTPMFPAQFEKIKTGFAAVKLSGGKTLKWDYNLYYRGLKDQFQLFREGAGFYTDLDGLWINNSTCDTISWYAGHNNHLTKIYGSGFNLTQDWKLGKTAFGVDYRFEQILSNVLGLDIESTSANLYTKSDARDNLSLFLQHAYISDRIIANLGGMAYWNQQYDWNFYWGADFGYRISNNLLIKTGLNKSMRLPTFTELYYNGPSNIGNPNLIPESALSAEIGIRYVLGDKSYVAANLFNRQGENIIAWVKNENTIKWETSNLTRLDTRGIELLAQYGDFKSSSSVNRLYLSYAYLNQDKSAAGLESKYTLDQLKHKLIIGVHHKVYKNVSAVWALNIFQRNGEYLNFDTETFSYTAPESYELTSLLNFKIEGEFKYFTVFVGLNNITNSDYFDIANVPTPGFSVNGGVNVKIVSQD